MSFPNELVKKKLQDSTILCFMTLLLVKGILPLLITPFGVPSHEVRLFEVWLVSNQGKELVDWLLENYIDHLPPPALIISQAFLSLFERSFAWGVVLVNRSSFQTSSFSRLNISTRDMRSWRSVGGLSVKSFQSTWACSWLLLTLLNISQSCYMSPNTLAIITKWFILAFSKCKERIYAFWHLYIYDKQGYEWLYKLLKAFNWSIR